MDPHLYPHNCCHKQDVKKGTWSEEEDRKLIEFINTNGYKNWSVIPILAGLQRCGKSCRLRWLNYLRPDLKRGNFTEKEARTIIELHKVIGGKWSKIASHLPGRTDNEVKNYWNATIRKQLFKTPKQDGSNTTTTTSVAPPVTSPTTIVLATNRGGGGGLIGGGSSSGVSYSVAPPPPPPPSFDHQGFNPNSFQEFGSISNLIENTHQQNLNADVINPEVLVPNPSMVQNPPPFQPTLTSNNDNYPLNFNQISQGESFVPFLLPDITASSDILDWNFPVYPYVDSPDSSMMMMANAEETNTVPNNISNTPIEEMDFLDTIFSPFPPEPSPPSSGSSFLDDEASAFMFDFAENPNIDMFDF